MNLTKDKILWIIYLLIGLILILGTNEQRLHKANLLSSTVYYPLITNVRKIEELFEVRQRNRILSEKVAEYQILANKLENDLSSVKSILSLSNLENIVHSETLDFAVASVVAYRGSYTNRTLIIDKGSLDGVQDSFPVISEDGVVGKIITVFPKHSIVLPITSPLLKLGVITKKSSVQGLLEADISGNIYMTMIPSGARISVGDSVMTSSVSTIFPRGYSVGTVSRLLKTPEDVFTRAVVNPFTKVNNLEQVIILFYRKELPESS